MYLPPQLNKEHITKYPALIHVSVAYIFYLCNIRSSYIDCRTECISFIAGTSRTEDHRLIILKGMSDKR